MEEYEIRDVSRRGDVPDLRIQFGLPTTELITIVGTYEFEPVKLQAVITNDAIEPAYYALVKLFIDARLELIAANGLGVNMERNRSIPIADKEFPVTVISISWGGLSKMPIFYALFKLVDDLLFKVPMVDKSDSSQCFIIGYEIKSPRMPVKTSYALLGVQSGNIYLLAENLNVEEVLTRYGSNT